MDYLLAACFIQNSDHQCYVTAFGLFLFLSILVDSSGAVASSRGMEDRGRCPLSILGCRKIFLSDNVLVKMLWQMAGVGGQLSPLNFV